MMRIDLAQKYAYYESERIIFLRRRIDQRLKRRRPWDGYDGEKFQYWCEHMRDPTHIPLNWTQIKAIDDARFWKEKKKEEMGDDYISDAESESSDEESIDSELES